MAGTAPDFSTDVNPYEVLGLGLGSPQLSAADIKSAYRKKALLLHPDKRKQTERAVAEREFNELQKAYEILCDDAARAAWDGYAAARAARAERDRGLDERRKKLKQDLEARERDFATRRSDEEFAKARLKQEIERLRKAAADKAARAQTANNTAPPQPVSAEAATQLARSLKAAWDRSRGGDYTAAELRAVFSAFGDVDDVLIRDVSNGKAHKGSALIVMATAQGAATAAASPCGDTTRPLLVVPAAGKAASNAANGGPAAPPPRPSAPPLFRTDATPHSPPAGNGTAAASTSGFPSFSFGGGGGGGGAVPQRSAPHGIGGSLGRDYEHVTLHRMRAAAERAKAVAAAEAAEAAAAKGIGADGGTPAP